jgi:protocadherin delta 2
MHVGFIFSIFIRASFAIDSYIYLHDRKVQEELPVGTLIIDLNEELSSKGLNRSSFIEQYTFLDDTKANSTNIYFLVDIVTGRITTKRYIDRESMCLNKHCLNPCDVNSGQQQQFEFSCKMNLKILLMPLSNILSVNILIEDINDNQPKWRKESLNHSIYENVPVGYKIPIDSAYDPDVGENSIANYKLNNQFDKTFELEQSANELALIVRKPLDRERKAFYNFSIIAYDGGRPTPFTGKLSVNLYILDINDNNPIFGKDLYRFKIAEDSKPNILIGVVHATDLDDGLNGQIKYSISGTQNEMVCIESCLSFFVSIILNDSLILKGDKNLQKSDRFYINSTTGQLYLKNTLDYEEESQLNIIIEARDLNGQNMQLSLASYCTVEIMIVDCNDNEPEISVSFKGSLLNGTRPTEKNQIYLREHTEPNEFIAHVSIADQDSGDNSRIGWSVSINQEQMDTDIPDGVILKAQKLSNSSFILSTGKYSSQLMDRELNSHLNISIIAWDYGSPPLRTTFNFTINLIDINDHKPKFNHTFYNLTITENNDLNALLYKFEANDLDLNSNAKIRISLRDFDSNTSTMPFRIDGDGYLYANAVFDREVKETYMFYVVASDMGKILKMIEKKV